MCVRACACVAPTPTRQEHSTDTDTQIPSDSCATYPTADSDRITEDELDRISAEFLLLIQLQDAAQDRLRERWMCNLDWALANDQVLADLPKKDARVRFLESSCAAYSGADSD